MNGEEDARLDELLARFLERFHRGEAPDIAAYAAQHPEAEARLRELLPLVLRMEGYAKAQAAHAPAEPPPLPALEGTDFRLLGKLGEGGMGVVYEAEQCSLHRRVALKLLTSPHLSGPERRAALAQEAQIIARLHHPNIVKVYSADFTSEPCHYAMELIRGTGLHQYPMANLREVARIALQTAQALAYAHRCKVLHRDVKPSNILVDTEGNAHVSDFGLAFELRHPDGLRENPDQQSGTLRYMAPERLAHGINTFAGDQYAFGVTFYEVVSRRPAHTETGLLPPLHCAEPDLAAIFDKYRNANPEARYPSMENVADDLRRFLNHEVVLAAKTSPLHRLRLWARRKPGVAALSGLGAALAVALLFALVVGYLRTDAARRLAERNAAQAHATLEAVFAHIKDTTPTAEGTALLERLLPYYQTIAQQGSAPLADVAKAHEVVGLAALRSGNAPLAARAFQALLALRPNPEAMKQLGKALLSQDRAAAETVFRQLVERYPASAEAVFALRMLGEEQEAFDRVRALLEASPKEAEPRFQYALLLGAHPKRFRTPKIAGVEPNAVVLLSELAESAPERPDYGLALMDLMCRRLTRAPRDAEVDDAELELTLACADRLLGRFPNTPGVVEAVVALRQATIAALRKRGVLKRSRKETERLQGMLELLSHNPQTPESVKSLWQTLQATPPNLRLSRESSPSPPTSPK